MRTIFFGTPDFAVPTLAALAASPHAPLLVVSQPARPAGRGGSLRQPPVAAWALDAGIEVAQPEKVKDTAFMERLEALQPDVAVVVAFGQIFRRRLLDLPTHGCINLHASLLPRWRGAAPIHAAIAAGDTVTGITTMQMDRGLDTGDMLLRRELTIEPDETQPELAERLAALGAPLMVETLDRLATGSLIAEPQDHDHATLAPRMSRDDALVDWRWPANQIHDRWRAFQPWPGLATTLADTPLKLRRVRPVNDVTTDAPEGTIVELAGDALRVACGGGTILELVDVQRPGKKAVSGRAWAHGERLELGDTTFSSPPPGLSSFALPCA